MLDRFKKAAQPAFYVRDVIDSRIEEKVIECSRIGIGRDDAFAMPRGQQRLYSASRSQIQSAARRPTNREVRESERRRINPQDMIGFRMLTLLFDTIVSDDEPVAE
jgi:hypothetical protein